ncbi:MAG: response regulator [Deltaproteobacteria bacterium]|nr:response regulator [Deltaproteobacteria bacterium]
MGKRSGIFRFGMIKKLVLINVLVFLVFGMIVLAVLFVFRNMEGMSKSLIENNVNRVIANGQLGRELTRILADTDLITDTYLYGSRDVTQEGNRIVNAAAALEAKSEVSHLKTCLRGLTGELRSLFEGFSVVRGYSDKLEVREKTLNRGLESLEVTLSEKLISRVLEGKDATILEQISIIIPGYRETLLQISLERMKLGLYRTGLEKGAQGRRLLELLDDLHLRLRTLTASDPDISAYGKLLKEGVTVYRREALLFLQAFGDLEKRLDLVNTRKRHILEDMKTFDAQVAIASGGMVGRVTAVMKSSGNFIVATSVTVIVLLGVFSVFFIMSNIRRPLRLIRQGIESIRQGNLDTRIQLERRDEWSVIEQALNDMVADLRTSYDDLKGMNTEMVSARADLQGKVRELEEQIRERERAEQDLKNSEEKWHSLYENLPGGCFTVNDQYVIEDVNDVLCAVTGYAREDLIGQLCGIICPKGPHKCPIFDLGKERIENDETAVKASDGNLVPIIKSARRIPVGSRDVIVENFQDITDRKLLEEQLQHARKMEAVGQLAGGVAHDFNNILTAIIGYGTLLQMKIVEEDPLRGKVDQILGAAERAADLTRSLLTLSRRRVVELLPVVLSACVTDMEGLLSRLIREDIDFRTDIVVGPLTVMGDKSQLEQILINLVTNARDSMPDGGSLLLRLDRREMDESFVHHHGFGQPGKYAVLEVSDSGMGMDRQTRERIFEPFFTTKRIGKGTGLGLAIVYGIVQQHNGFIEVTSEEGIGSTFHVYLPEIESKYPCDSLPGEAEPAGGTETILLAEDEQTVRALVQSVLEKYGYTVLVADNGADAVERFREHRDRIDLLILDVIMPKMNGKDVFNLIRSEAPRMKALFMSGYTGDILSNKGILEEGLSFISKPVPPKALLRKVRLVLEA